MAFHSFIKLALAMCLLLAVSGIAHVVLPMPPHLVNPVNHSSLAKSIGFPVLASLYMLCAYIITAVTILLQKRYFYHSKATIIIPCLLASIWLSSYFEFLFPGDTIITSTILGLVDVVPIFFLALISCMLFAKQGTGNEQANLLVSSFNKLRVILIAGTVACSRISGYALGLRSAFTELPVITILHALALGFIFALGHELFITMQDKSFYASFRYILLFVLPNWFIVNLFIPLMLTERYIDFIIFRTLTDTAAILLPVIAIHMFKTGGSYEKIM